MSASDSGVDVMDQKVREMAYLLWLERGAPEGSPLDDWLEAERTLLLIERRFGLSDLRYGLRELRCGLREL